MATTDPDRHTPATGRFAALAGHLDPPEPRPMRGPFTRWPRTADAVLACVVFGVALVSVAVSGLGAGAELTLGAIVGQPVGAYVLLAVASAALWWRRSRPIVVAATVFAAALVWAFAGYGDGEDVTYLLAVYSAGRYCADRRLSMSVVAAAFASSVLGSVIDSSQRIDVWPAVVLTALPWYLGVRVRQRGEYLALLRERAERREAEQRARTDAALADERARIARELHDVVAHQVSMMTVQAGAAKMVARDDLDAAIAAMADIEQAGRGALGELRHLLGVLRLNDSEDADDHELGPQPGLAEVASLVERLRGAGADVELTLADVPELPTAVDLSVFRIVQESVTNIVKHAGSRPRVSLAITHADGWLDLRVTNTVDDTAPHPDLPISGYGIAGMRERAALLGGTLTAGPLTPHRFTVHVRLPLERGPR